MSSSSRNWPQNIQDRAKTLGITADQYMQIAENLPGGSGVGAVSYTGGGSGNYNPQGGSGDESTYLAVARQLRLNQAMGGANQGGSQSNQPTQPVYSSVDQNPMFDLSRLGAAALGEQEIVNPMPGPADKKSGIGTVTQPQISKNKVTAPVGPWSNMPGVFGKQGTQNQQGSAPEGTPALDTIGTKMTPQQFSDVANQIRNGSTNYVTVNGKPYTITGDNINHITSSFPQQTSQWTQTAPQTTPLTPTPQTTAAAAGANTGLFGGGNTTDFGTQVATTAIQQEIQRQLSQGNAYASTGTGPPPGWHPSTGQPPGTVTPPQPISAPPAPVNTGNPPGMTVGQFGAAGAGAPSDWGTRFNTASAMAGAGAAAAGAGAGMGNSLTYTQKMQLLQAPAQAAQQWAQNVGNSFRPIASAIPGPEDFRQPAPVALQRATTV